MVRGRIDESRLVSSWIHDLGKRRKPFLRAGGKEVQA
jgi:hypothetical protein